MSKIRNIIFDLSEVLLTGIKDTGVALAEKHKIDDAFFHPVPWSRFKTPLLVPLVEEFFHGNVSEDEYIRAVLKEYPQVGTQEWLKEHIRENFKEVEGTREIILELQKSRYKLALLSVHSREWIDYCEKKFKFHDLFYVISYSFDEKVSKPDPVSFKNILKKLNAQPEECLFIDDSEKNIVVAETLGIKSILFTNAENLRKDLRKILKENF
jgi:HAD superfamily hydrolase (TIGR01509 family)